MAAELLVSPQLTELSPLPPELEPLFVMDESLPPVRALENLPFVHASELQRSYGEPTIDLGVQRAPVDRIVCSPRDIDSWNGSGSVKRLPDGSPQSTFERAVSMAQHRSYNDSSKPMVIALFRDSRGEIWGRVVDGSHRVIAAKLNGEQSVEARLQTTADLAAMDYYAGDVIAEAQARALAH